MTATHTTQPDQMLATQHTLTTSQHRYLAQQVAYTDGYPPPHGSAQLPPRALQVAGAQLHLARLIDDWWQPTAAGRIALNLADYRIQVGALVLADERLVVAA